MWKNIGKGGIWFAIYFGLQNIFSIIFALIYLGMHADMMPTTEDVNIVMNFVVEVVMQTIMPALIASSLAMILIYVIHRRVIKEPLHIKTVDWQKIVFFAGVACVLNVLCNLLVTFLSNLVPPAWMGALEDSTGAVSMGQPFWVLLLGTGILVPIMEELTFRYGIHGYAAKSNVVLAYVLSSIVFGIMHGNPVQIIYAALMGFILAWIYQKTGNLWYPITIHAVNNSMSLVSTLMVSETMYLVMTTAIGLLIVFASIICFDNVKRIFHKPIAK
ncbi:MAG: CPBP family intramembrane metalloprotease [Bacteroidaceae bacterium]|nr:CPBP family intramembrane metalloprotease [Bacteroidaceae bacterium]